MDLNQLIEKRNSDLVELETIISTGKNENRLLDENEISKVNKIKENILSIDRTIEEKKNPTKKIIVRKMENKFSLLKTIEARSNGRVLDDLAQSVVEAGKREMGKSGISTTGDIVLPMEFRGDILAGTSTQGQEIVSEEKFSLLGPLRDSLVLVSAGGNFIGNLVGDVSIPVYAGSSAAWKGEVTAAADGAGLFTEVTMSPKRLTTYIDISKQFLNQDSVGAEALLYQDIINAVTGKLENTVLGSTTGSTQPSGLFYGTAKFDQTADVTWAKIVSLETAVNVSNALKGNLSYILGASGYGVLKTTSKVSGTTGFILEDNTLNGHKYFATNAIAQVLSGSTEIGSGILFGNFNDLIIGQWGGFDIIVDPYTVAKEGKVRLVINTYWDVKPRRTESFAFGYIKV